MQRLMAYLAHGGEDVGLAVVVTVGTDAEVHLLGAGVLVEGEGDAEDGVLGSLGDVRPHASRGVAAPGGQGQHR